MTQDPQTDAGSPTRKFVVALATATPVPDPTHLGIRPNPQGIFFSIPNPLGPDVHLIASVRRRDTSALVHSSIFTTPERIVIEFGAEPDLEQFDMIVIG